MVQKIFEAFFKSLTRIFPQIFQKFESNDTTFSTKAQSLSLGQPESLVPLCIECNLAFDEISRI